MTKKEIDKVISTEYLKPTDWYNVVVGVMVGSCLYGSIAVVIVMKLGAARPFNLITLLVVLVFIIYLYWRDGKVKVIRTGLSKEENLEILRRVFEKLNWPVKVRSNQIEIQDGKYILRFINPTILYTDDYIAYNFQYRGNYKGGRPAFFIGIRTYLRNKFKTGLRNHLHDKIH